MDVCMDCAPEAQVLKVCRKSGWIPVNEDSVGFCAANNYTFPRTYASLTLPHALTTEHIERAVPPTPPYAFDMMSAEAMQLCQR
jgi:hypothetical protein